MNPPTRCVASVLVLVALAFSPAARADKQLKDDAKSIFKDVKIFTKDVFKKTKNKTKKVVGKVKDKLDDDGGGKDGRSPNE